VGLRFTHDRIGQLKVADTGTASEDRGYTYDAAWNLNCRTNHTTLHTFRVDPKNQLTNSTPGGVGTYDANGNLTGLTPAGPLQRLGYDDENQLVTVTNYLSVTKPGTRTDFYYDGLGRLRRRVEWTWVEDSFALTVGPEAGAGVLAAKGYW